MTVNWLHAKLSLYRWTHTHTLICSLSGWHDDQNVTSCQSVRLWSASLNPKQNFAPSSCCLYDAEHRYLKHGVPSVFLTSFNDLSLSKLISNSMTPTSSQAVTLQGLEGGAADVWWKEMKKGSSSSRTLSVQVEVDDPAMACRQTQLSLNVQMINLKLSLSLSYFCYRLGFCHYKDPANARFWCSDALVAWRFCCCFVDG